METRETLICHKCGGNGKPSKGYMNFHNIQTSDRSKEFETKLLDCIKCESCGHSWIPEISTREQAIAYFNSLPSVDQQMLTDRYFNERHKQSLTGREIEKIWLKETGGELATGGEKVLEILNSKPNAKEFKQFDESLFKAYISKFSDEDKLKMWDWLTSELSNTVVKTRFEKILKQLY